MVRLVAIAMLTIACGWLLWAHSEWFRDPTRVKAEIVACGVWGPVVFILLYAVGPSFLLPGAVMTTAGGLIFRTWWGALYSLIGANLGAVVAFGAGRFMGRSFVDRIVDRRFHRLADKVAERGFQITFYLRLVPVIPYNAFNLLAGASPIGFRDYFWASIIGMVPGTILFAFLGDELWHPLSLKFFLAVLLIAATVACGELWRRWSSVDVQ
jgi:uncharacterized membrane protein YdjX (TVP38/TMEM64 family)